jgi:hypothetical protein
MSQNLQLQKIVNPHASRIRHRRALVVSDPRFPSRHPGLANFLTREATRANATPLRLAEALAVIAGGTGYSVGDKFSITGGTSTIPAAGVVTAVAAGVVTAAKIIDGGAYTIVPPAASATVHTRIKNGATPAGNDLTVTATLTAAVVGVTGQELLSGIRAVEDVGGTVPIITRARHFRDPRQTSVTYTDNGVPIA